VPTKLANSSHGGVTTDPRIHQILERSCYTCHSTTGTAPWYAALSPAYMAAGSARQALNFSDWSTYDAHHQQTQLKSIESTINNGSMPPGNYTVLDHSARLSNAEKQALRAWLATQISSGPQ